MNRQSEIDKREGAGGSLTRIHPNTVTPDADARTAYEVSTPRKKFFEVAVTRAEYADLFARKFIELQKATARVRIGYSVRPCDLIL